MFIPKEVFLIFVILLLGSWFLLGEKKSFMEKVSIILAVVFLYVAFRVMSGASIQEILTPLTK